MDEKTTAHKPPVTSEDLAKKEAEEAQKKAHEQHQRIARESGNKGYEGEKKK